MRFEEAICKQQKPTDAHRWPHMTIGHLCDAIMSIHNEADAKEFRDGYIKWLEDAPDFDRGRMTPAQCADANIGWFFGEGMPEEDRAIWRKLGASHPIFGSMRENPTVQEAISAGFHRAKEVK